MDHRRSVGTAMIWRVGAPGPIAAPPSWYRQATTVGITIAATTINSVKATITGKTFVRVKDFVTTTPPKEATVGDKRHREIDTTAQFGTGRLGQDAQVKRFVVASSRRAFVTCSRTQAVSSRLQPNEAPPCARGCIGKTTQLCPFCGDVKCWKCAKEEAKPLCRVQPCSKCEIYAALEAEKDDIEDFELASKSIARSAERSAHTRDGKAKPDTRTRRANAIEAFGLWARISEGRIGMGIDRAPSAKLWVRYVEARSNGEAMACPTTGKPVAEATIQKTVTAMRLWIARMNDTCDMNLVDTSYSMEVQGALRIAKDLGPVPNKRKAPVTEAKYKELYTKLRDPLHYYPQRDQFLMRQYFIATSGIWNLLPRRNCYARRHWDPSYLKRDLVTPSNQAALGQDTQPWKWGIDDAHDQWVRALIGLEKNQPQQALTTRWSTDKHWQGFAVAEDLHVAFTACDMPAGPTLRKSRDSKVPWTPADWTRYIDFISNELDMVGTFGTTSLRRGYATALRESHGLTQEYIRLLGYWRSDAANDYDGAAMAVRLNCQKLRPGMVGGSLSSYSSLQAFKTSTPQRSTAMSTSGTSQRSARPGVRSFVRVDTGAAASL